MLVDTGDFHGLLFRRLIEEHREILALLDTIRGRDASFARLVRAIRIHFRAEEAIVFPKLDGSYELGHHVRIDQAQHRAIDAMLRDLEHVQLGGAEWLDRLAGLRDQLVAHFADEENVVFPRAHNVISSPDEQALLVLYEQEREFLTSRVTR